MMRGQTESKGSTYVLITPARNEEALIEKTIQSVIAQTVIPRKWVIVSDGSTDRTDEIVSHYTKSHGFIALVRLRSRGKRDFGSKAHAFKIGYEQVKNEDYNFIGNLDADVSFDPDYYARVLEAFRRNPRMGVAGGIILDHVNGRFCKLHYHIAHVSGAVQLFRRACFEQIGGYLPLPFGGIDSIADISARMHGWETRTLPELEVKHHRRIGMGQGSVLAVGFRDGVRDYSLGYRPFFELGKCIIGTHGSPRVVSGLLRISGYFWALLRRDKPVVPKNVLTYFRSEQSQRLWSFMRAPGTALRTRKRQMTGENRLDRHPGSHEP